VHLHWEQEKNAKVGDSYLRKLGLVYTQIICSHCPQTSSLLRGCNTQAHSINMCVQIDVTVT
jgi:hypothetical protein